jgi:hypothetical protein
MLSILLFSQMGCATIINGQEQEVSITSDPPGATVMILPEKVEVATPADVELPRGKVHTIKFELDGYEPRYGFLDRAASSATLWNILLGGLIGLAIDYSSDAVYKLTPDPLHMTLEKSPQEPGGTPLGGPLPGKESELTPRGAP